MVNKSLVTPVREFTDYAISAVVLLFRRSSPLQSSPCSPMLAAMNAIENVVPLKNVLFEKMVLFCLLTQSERSELREFTTFPCLLALCVQWGY